MKKYILFDHDGVLVDTEFYYYSANVKALSEIGIEMSLDRYMEYMITGMSFWDLAKKTDIDGALIKEQRTKRNQYYQDFLTNENIEIEGVEQVLEELSASYRMAIVTTSKKEDFELIHKNRNLVSYMDFVLTLEDYDNAKPHPEPYLKGLELFGASREETIVVEDSARGLSSAVSAGLECVIVHNDFTRTHDFSKATYKIESLKDLPLMLKQKNSKKYRSCN